MNYPPISTHLTPPWEEEEEQLPSWEISVDFHLDSEEEVTHNECFTITCTRQEIDEEVKEQLNRIYHQPLIIDNLIIE